MSGLMCGRMCGCEECLARSRRIVERLMERIPVEKRGELLTAIIEAIFPGSTEKARVRRLLVGVTRAGVEPPK